MNSKLSSEDLLEINDHDEILTLIDLLVLRVDCLSNEKKKKVQETYPTVAEVDQNLIQYLYYLFTKFTNDDSEPSEDLSTPIIDKNNFVNVCQTLVRNGCFDIPSGNGSISSDHSLSESTSDQTLVSEYHPDNITEKTPIIEQETWLVVDLQPTESGESIEDCEAIVSLNKNLSPNDKDNTNNNKNIFSYLVYFRD
jgi:hypothetical protein